MPSILVISNCQTYGLANCLKLSGVEVHADGCDIDRFQRESDIWCEKIKGYDWIFVSPEAKAIKCVDFVGMDNVVWVPAVYFPAFHGDLTYATVDGVLVKTPMDAYNSRLVIAGYKGGLSQSESMGLFNAETYSRIGYIDLYDQSKNDLLELYGKYDIDLSSVIVSWMRSGCFMYSVNHPKIYVLYDIALLMLKKIGLPVRRHNYLPHDNLANGPIFPMYPEIASLYGFQGGTYFFKSAYDYKTYDLKEFIDASYEVYSALDMEKISYSELEGDYGAALYDIIEKVGK